MATHKDSVFDEPQFSGEPFLADATDAPLDASSASQTPLPVGLGAWDEPALSPDLAGDRPDNIQTYAQWLGQRRSQFSASRSWAITLGLALCGGIWAVVGALLSQVQANNAGNLLLIVVFGPVAEEMLKASAALITIEKWPYVFRSPVQIVLCCVAAALGFAVLENFLYLKLYLPVPSAAMIAWRWSICVAVHVAGSSIVSMGVVTIWRQSMSTGTAPRVSLGTPCFIMAATLHGTYNFCALFISPLLTNG